MRLGFLSRCQRWRFKLYSWISSNSAKAAAIGNFFQSEKFWFVARIVLAIAFNALWTIGLCRLTEPLLNWPPDARWRELIVGVGISHSFSFSAILEPAYWRLFVWELIVLAPLSEEIFFRKMVIDLVWQSEKLRQNCLVTVCLAISALFGFGHGGLPYVMLQGVFGAVMCWLYVANGRGWKGYLSIVACHATENLFCIFLYPKWI